MPKNRSFWGNFWDEYCRISHFHGFLEMRINDSVWNRIFWTFIIVAGFALGFLLVVLGIINMKPIATLVTVNKTGTLDMTVLYCPADWILNLNLEQSGATDAQVLYALSYLKDFSYMHDPLIYKNLLHDYDGWSWDSWDGLDSGINTGSRLDHCFILSLIARHFQRIKSQMNFTKSEAFILNNLEEQCRSWDGLSYPNELNAIVETTYVTMFALYSMNKTEDFWKMFRKYLILDYDALAGTEGVYDKTLAWYKERKDRLSGNICWTLKGLDQLESLDNLTEADFKKYTDCGTVFGDSSSMELQLSDISPNSVWAKFLLFKLFHEFEEDDHFTTLLENNHRKRIFEIMHQDDQYLNYRNSCKACPDTSMANYLSQGNNATELLRLIEAAAKKFVNKEQKSFSDFLKEKHFKTPFDFLLNLTVDPDHFLAWMSLSEDIAVEPEEAKIEARKIITGIGDCVQFRMTASKDNLTQSSEVANLRKSRVNRLRPYKRLHVNIIPLHEEKSFYKLPGRLDEHENRRRSDDLLIFADSVTDMVPGMREYDAVDKDDPLDSNAGIYATDGNSYIVNGTIMDYTLFKIKSLEIQKFEDRRGSHCKASDGEDPKYTYNNCLLTCDDYFTQPKMFYFPADTPFFPTSPPRRFPVKCYFALENLPDMLPKSGNKLQECSYFLYLESLQNYFNPDERTKVSHFDKGPRSKCLKSCVKACERQDLDIETVTKRLLTDGDDPYGILYIGAKQCAKDSQESIWHEGDEPTLHEEEEEKPTLEEEEPIMHSNLSDPTKSKRFPCNRGYSNDELMDIICHGMKCKSRIEIEVAVDGKIYEETVTMTWDSIVGIVGGQFGMVTGASLLTFVQFFWVLARQFIRKKGDRTLSTSTRRNRRQRSKTPIRNGKDPTYIAVESNDIELTV